MNDTQDAKTDWEAKDRANRDMTIEILEGMIQSLRGSDEEQSPLVVVFAKRGAPETKEDGTVRVNYETQAVAVFKGAREAEHLAETLNGMIERIRRRRLKELVEKLLGI